jgi:predicted permease
VFSDDGKGRLEAGTTWWLSVFGRLKPGWTLERATAHLQAISPDLFKTALPPTYPAESVPKYLKFTLAASSARTGVSPLREDYESPLWLLLAIAGLVFFIACANLTNLLLARATARSREIAIRLSLGASRGRVIRQLLTESLLLAAVGALFGVLLASMLSRSLVAFLNTDSSTITLPLGLDWRILGFSAGLAAATCALFGLAPALRATRVGAGSVMHATGRGNTANRETIGLRQVLVVAQVAVSVALLFGSLLFARSLLNAMLVDPGFHADGVTIVGVNFRALDVPEDRRLTFRRELIDRVRSLPGITSAGYVGIVPISGSGSGNDVWPEADRSRRFNTLRTTAGPGFFATLGIPILAGRDFEDRDTDPSRMIAIVNETFAEKLTGQRSPIGARFTIQATPSRPEETYDVVGVVRNSKYMDLKESAMPVLYTAERRPVRYAEIVVRSALPPSSVASAITTAMANVDSRIGLTYTVFTTQIRDTLVLDRLLATLSGGFGALAAILTVVGLYGLIAYSVTRRTSEIGVRMALGAQRSDIARLMLRETSILLAVGIVVGIGIALAGARAASALLFGVRPHDPLTLAGAIAGLALIAFAASYAPARRATRIEPVAALRME